MIHVTFATERARKIALDVIGNDALHQLDARGIVLIDGASVIESFGSMSKEEEPRPGVYMDWESDVREALADAS